MRDRSPRIWFYALVIGGLLSVASGAYHTITIVSHAEVTSRLEITGRFGQPLGRIISIEGNVIGENEQPWKGRDTSKTAVLVGKINDHMLKRPVMVECSLRDVPQAGSKVRLKGFETGGFSGMSDDVVAWHKSRYGVPQARGWHFAVEFIVLEPSQAPPPPTPLDLAPQR